MIYPIKPMCKDNNCNKYAYFFDKEPIKYGYKNGFLYI